MMRRMAFLVAGIVLSVCCAGQAQVTEISVPVCTTPPVLDADLADPAWKEAVKLSPFFKVLEADAGPARTQTTAWMCRDDTWLYIALRCDEPAGLNLRANARHRDSDVAGDDSIEVFLDPGNDGKRYYQFLLSVTNVQADQLCEGDKRNRDWNLPWRSAAKRDAHLDTATGWSVEMAFPLALIQEKAGPGAWKINLYRTRRAATPAEHTSLAKLPPGTGYHAPASFLPVKGLNDFRAKVPFGPMLVSADVEPLEISSEGYAYSIRAVVENATGKGGTVEVAAEDIPRAGKGRQVSRQVALGLVDKKEVVIRVPMSEVGPRDARVVLRDPSTGQEIQQAYIDRTEKLTPYDAYVERSYYTGEQEAVVHARMMIEPEECAKAGLQLQAAIVDGKGKELASGRTAAVDREISLSLPLKSIPVGTHSVRVNLVSARKQNFGTMNLALAKREPGPPGANELKIDFYRRCLVLNGKPWFPVGAFGMGHHGRMKDNEFRIRQYEFAYKAAADAGLDMVTDWKGFGASKPLEDCRIDYDLCQKYGLKVFGRLTLEGPDASYSSPNFKQWARKQFAEMDPYLEFCATHPAVVGYYHFDEPYGGLNIDDVLEEFTARVHEKNPYFLVYMSLTRQIHESQRKWFGPVADLIGAHNYWYVDRPESLNRNAESFHVLDQESRRVRRPTMHAPQLDCWGSGYTGGGFMTPHEQRAQTYFALVHGAKSLMYFVMPWKHEVSVATQRQISEEVREMAPALLDHDMDPDVTFEPKEAVIPGATPRTTFPVVQAALHEYPNGDQLLLAINGSFKVPVTARFSLSSLTGNSTAQALFGEKKRYEVRDGGFTDTIEPWGTRAYLLKNVWKERNRPVKVHLAMTFPETPVTGTADAGTPAPETVNILPNPGFEDSEAKGWNGSHGRPGPGKVAELAKDDPRSGSQYLKITRKAAGEMVEFISDPVQLKAGTRYSYGGWIRMSLTEGKEAPYFILLSTKVIDGQRRINSMVPVPLSSGSEWQKASRTVTAPADTPETVWVYCRVPKSVAGEVGFDDVFVEEVTEAPRAAAPAKKNLLFNSSFETARLPGAPHGWWPMAELYLIPHPRSCAQDDRNPYHGKYSYRLVKESNSYIYAGPMSPIIVKEGQPYTLSVYMRAEKPNSPVSLYYWGGKVDFYVGTEWKRYTATAPMKGRTFTQFGYYLGGESVVYLDAMQMEGGTEATDYEAN